MYSRTVTIFVFSIKCLDYGVGETPGCRIRMSQACHCLEKRRVMISGCSLCFCALQLDRLRFTLHSSVWCCRDNLVIGRKKTGINDRFPEGKIAGARS